MVDITLAYLDSQGLSKTFPERFWSKVLKTDSCWLWTAYTDDMGYGYINGSHGKVMIAPRASWILNVGPIPEGGCVLHNCPGGDNPRCVNPAHLWIGNRTENMEDKIKKGRQPCGEQVGGHKLTRPKAEQARVLYATGRFTLKALAETFGVTLSTMHSLIRFKTWNH